MGVKTQIKLAQLTGSFGNTQKGQIHDNMGPVSAFTGFGHVIDLSGSLGAMASAIRRINGGAIFAANDFGILKDVGGQTRISYVDSADTVISSADGNNTLTLQDDGDAIFSEKIVAAGGEINRGSAAALSIGGDMGANTMTLGQAASTISIPGNLTVAGTTTTLDVNNLNVEDQLILLNDGDQTIDSFGGIVIASGSNTTTLTDMFFGRLGQEVFGAAIVNSKSGSILSLPTEGHNSGTGFMQIPIQGSKFYVSGSSNNIALIPEDSNKLGITGAVAVTANAPAFEVMNSNDANAGKLLIYEAADNGGSAVGFQAPALGGDTTYTLPTAFPSSNGMAFVSTTGGVMSFSAVSAGAADSRKFSQTLTGSILAGQPVAANSGGEFATMNIGTMTDANASKALDVYLNGQLMASSSTAYASITEGAGAAAAVGDYSAIVPFSNSAFDLKFTFDLEADDVVTVIARN